MNGMHPPRLASRRTCTGCSACLHACPAGAIGWSKGPGGFRYPTVDATRCVRCGRCARTCPALRSAHGRPPPPLAVFAAQAVDEEVFAETSSGGVADRLAQAMVDSGGVVCGAAWDGNFRVRHVFAEESESLARFRKSKYVQSDLGFVFRDIRSLLRRGRDVLFIGTACQVDGLLSFVGDPAPGRLRTASLLCHGVPSQKLFDDYLAWIERRAGRKAAAFSFRNKARGWTTSETVWFDGGPPEGEPGPGWYLRCFVCAHSVRPCCMDCRYRKRAAGDVTLGDYWRGGDPGRVFPKPGGISKVVVNTDAGMEMWKAVRGRFHVLEKRTCDAGLSDSQPYRGILRGDFLRDYDRHGFEYVLRKYPSPFLLWQRRNRTLPLLLVQSAVARIAGPFLGIGTKRSPERPSK